MTGWQLFLSGGPLMWPILICAILSCAIALERFFYLDRARKENREMLSRILDQVKRNQIREAVQTCEGCLSPVVGMLKAGILKYDRPRSQIKESLESASLYEIPKLEKNLPLLSTLAHLSPLLGFLAAVAAMINCFHAVWLSLSASGALPAADLARCIWQALVATFAGLGVAVLSFAAYNFLAARVNALIIEMERASAELLNSLSE